MVFDGFKELWSQSDSKGKHASVPAVNNGGADVVLAQEKPLTEKELTRLEAKQQIATLLVDGHFFMLLPDKIKMDSERQSLQGVEIRLETSDEVQSRITASRVVLLGPFAAFVPKKSHTRYLTVEGPEFFWSAEVKQKKVKEVQRFMTAVKNQVKKNQHSPS